MATRQAKSGAPKVAPDFLKVGPNPPHPLALGLYFVEWSSVARTWAWHLGCSSKRIFTDGRNKQLYRGFISWNAAPETCQNSWEK